MKFKTTILLLAVFLALLAAVLFLDRTGGNDKDNKTALVSLSAEDVERIVLKKKEEMITFQKNDAGDWMIVEPLEAAADKYEVDRLAEDFADLDVERVVEEAASEVEKYGIPKTEVTLSFKGKEDPVKILIGDENPLDNTLFAQREGEARVVLLSSFLKSRLDKNLNDFRKKDIFSFETGDVKSLRVRSKSGEWSADKREDEWFLTAPVQALAEKYEVDGVVSALSDLKAKAFVSEDKTEEEVKTYGLDKADCEAALQRAEGKKEIKFFLQKSDSKVYATTSISNKIIEVEDSILSKLEKAVPELREKEVVDFYSWEAQKLYLRKGGMELTLVKSEKKGEETWRFEAPEKAEADRSKVETFIRKIEGLEAEEFIDPPLNLADYGLDNPQAEVRIWVKENEEKPPKEYAVLIGREIVKTDGKKEKTETAAGEDTVKAKNEKRNLENSMDETAQDAKDSSDDAIKLVVVKNLRFDYLFKVKADILSEFPKDASEWKTDKREK